MTAAMASHAPTPVKIRRRTAGTKAAAIKAIPRNRGVKNPFYPEHGGNTAHPRRRRNPPCLGVIDGFDHPQDGPSKKEKIDRVSIHEHAHLVLKRRQNKCEASPECSPLVKKVSGNPIQQPGRRQQSSRRQQIPRQQPVLRDALYNHDQEGVSRHRVDAQRLTEMPGIHFLGSAQVSNAVHIGWFVRQQDQHGDLDGERHTKYDNDTSTLLCKVLYF